MKKVARLRIPQDEQQFIPPGGKISGNVEQTLVRTTGRIKKPKAVFDPSDNYVPRSQRGLQTSPATTAKNTTTTSVTSAPRERSSSTGSNTSNSSISQEDICIVCLKREPRRGGNYRNKLIPCVDCSKRVHRMCMSVDYYEAAPLRQNYKCENCRICEVCSTHESDTKPNNELITCAKCCKSFHLTCHTPKVAKFQQSQRHWKCFKCNPNNTITASLQSGNNNNNNKKETVLPVKIIRQIIGDDTNLPNALQIQQSSQTALQQLSRPIKPPSQPQPQQQEQQQQQKQQEKEKEKEPIKLEPPKEQQLINIAEAAVEASAKAAALRRKRTESLPKTESNGDYHSDDSAEEDNENEDDGDDDDDEDDDDEDEDEDFEYVEKKKRKLVQSPSNQKENDSSQITEKTADTESEKKPILNVNQYIINDLPKREIVKCWSVERVAAYVANYFPNEAQVFKDQEIDGNALLLLKRSDVVQKLPLKLGPSLRLYNLILKIQTQTANDPTLGWDCSVDTLLPTTE